MVRVRRGHIDGRKTVGVEKAEANLTVCEAISILRLDTSSESRTRSRHEVEVSYFISNHDPDHKPSSTREIVFYNIVKQDELVPDRMSGTDFYIGASL